MSIASLLAISIVACQNPATDPDHGVSTAGYRKSMAQAEGDVAAVVSKLIVAQKKDRSDQWWKDVIDALSATRDQLHDVQLGSTK